MADSGKQSTRALPATSGAFMVFFAVFFFTGFVQTCRSTRRDELTQHTIYKHLRLVESDSRQFSLVYSCGRRDLYVFDVDENRLAQTLPGVLAESRSRRAGGRPLAIDANVLASFVGGASGAWTVKDVVTQVLKPRTSRSRLRHLLAALSGALAGYYSGFYVGFTVNADCNDEDIHVLLRNRDYWLALEQDVLAEIHESAVRPYAGLDQMQRIVLDRELPLSNLTQVNAGRFTSADFVAALQEKRATDEAMRAATLAHRVVGGGGFYGFIILLAATTWALGMLILLASLFVQNWRHSRRNVTGRDAP